MRRSLLVSLLALAGCAFQPVVDLRGDPNAFRYAQDLQECRGLAEQVAGPGTGAAVGAGIGYGLGFLMCSALRGSNCSSTGRAVAVAGAASGAGSGAQSEAQVVRNCLIERGHPVLN